MALTVQPPSEPTAGANGGVAVPQLRRVLSLPVYPDLTDDHVERVCDVIRSAHEHAVELDAYVSTMAEVDARMFELD